MSAKASEQIDAIACGAITDRVSVTVAHDADGWGFFAWADWNGEPIPTVNVRADELSRRFRTPREAIAHCRALYHQRLMLAPPPGSVDDIALEQIGRRSRYRVAQSRDTFYATYETLRQRLETRLKRRKW